MEIRTYIGIIARFWWVILLSTLAAVAGAALLSSIKTPMYSAHARVVVRPAPGINDSRTVVDLVGQMGARYVVNTFAQTFTSAQVISDSLKAVKSTPADVSDYSLSANVLPDTNVIEVTGTGPDPNFLTKYINATVTATTSDSHDLFQVVELASLEPASAPLQPTSPQPFRDIPLAGLLGLGVGILLTLLFDYLRRPAPVSVPTTPSAAGRQPDWTAPASPAAPAPTLEILPHGLEGNGQQPAASQEGGWLPSPKPRGGTAPGRGRT